MVCFVVEFFEQPTNTISPVTVVRPIDEWPSMPCEHKLRTTKDPCDKTMTYLKHII